MLRRNNIRSRAFTALNLEQFNKVNRPDLIGYNNTWTGVEDLNILRMPIRIMNDVRFYIPEGLMPEKLHMGVIELLRSACLHQKLVLKVSHPFAYLTIRKGEVISKNDDVWHTDGFSTKYTHIPEQNYIWSDCFPTEYVTQKIRFPKDFNPLDYNIHLFIQDRVKSRNIKQLKENTLYCLDPYVIHRRPFVPQGTIRTFIRISFTPIEIADVNNTPNPIPVVVRDGVKDFRDKLLKY